MEKEIKDAEIEESIEENSMEDSLTETGKKKNYKVELILFLVLGFLIGIVIKTEAGKRVTMGFDDYKIAALHQDYDLNKVQKELTEKAEKEAAEAAENGEDPVPAGGVAGGACGI
ncbi:hypothetical protein ACFLY1_00085 [Patescibacteria group bacterium]